MSDRFGVIVETRQKILTLRSRLSRFTWNSLPESVISAGTIDTFKSRLDKLWRNQDVLFDYKANLTGIGNRSEKNEEDFI